MSCVLSFPYIKENNLQYLERIFLKLLFYSHFDGNGSESFFVIFIFRISIKTALLTRGQYDA